MAYGKGRSGKGGKRRMYRKRRGLGAKSVKKIVKQVVNDGRETKSIQAIINQQAVYPYSQGNAGVINTAVLFALTPNASVTFPQGQVGLFQGTGQGQRIGNKVEFTKGTLRMMLSCNAYNSVSNPTPTPVIVRIFVGYDKTKAHGQPEESLPEFFQDGNTSRAPASNLTDMFSVVNTDRYTICYTRTVKVGYSEYFGTGTQPQRQYHTNNDYKLNPVVNIDFTKRMIHNAKFDDTSSTASGRTTWCWMLMSSSTGVGIAGAPLSIQCQIVNNYKDA